MSDAGASGDDLKRGFEGREKVHARLAEEVAFAVKRELSLREIKFHSVTSRVKTLASFREKAERLGLIDPLDELDDIVGVRVVVLFLSDLPRVEEALMELFEVIKKDNKLLEQEPSSFGYMSVHYVAKLKDEHQGPRYDELQGMKFEIQVRTIVMDAWASVSHYLDYKGETSIPSHLRRDFYALNGLFYVADQHFELFAGHSRISQERAGEEIRTTDSNPEANLDTVAALLEEVFPDRAEGRREVVSEFVEEVARYGYDRIRELERKLRAGSDAVEPYEAESPPYGRPGNRFSRVGAARHALATADPQYAAGEYPDEADGLVAVRESLGIEGD